MDNDDVTNPGPTPAGTVPTAHDVRSPRPRARFRIRRSPDDVMLSGVCAGLAEELDLDPALVRIAVVVLTVFTSGAAALAYLAAWILAPVEAAA